MASNPRVRPVINQIEVHPFNTQPAIRDACARHGIVVEAYAPLARAMRMRHPVIVRLAAKHACTPAQLFVRWSLQHGMVTLPKSARRERLVANVEVGGFEIGDADMAELDGLDEHLVTDWYVSSYCICLPTRLLSCLMRPGAMPSLTMLCRDPTDAP